MDIIHCKKCNRSVLPMSNGKCPGCQSVIYDEATAAKLNEVTKMQIEEKAKSTQDLIASGKPDPNLKLKADSAYYSDPYAKADRPISSSGRLIFGWGFIVFGILISAVGAANVMFAAENTSNVSLIVRNGGALLIGAVILLIGYLIRRRR